MYLILFSVFPPYIQPPEVCMRIGHSTLAFVISGLIGFHSIYTWSHSSSGTWVIILINYLVLLFYFGHFIWALVQL